MSSLKQKHFALSSADIRPNSNLANDNTSQSPGGENKTALLSLGERKRSYTNSFDKAEKEVLGEGGGLVDGSQTSTSPSPRSCVSDAAASGDAISPRTNSNSNNSSSNNTTTGNSSNSIGSRNNSTISDNVAEEEGGEDAPKSFVKTGGEQLSHGVRILFCSLLSYFGNWIR
tara:strand:+ start:247 stop:762 length:516 start_codon:yes stop_codon:yes gene_type:complete